MCLLPNSEQSSVHIKEVQIAEELACTAAVVEPQATVAEARPTSKSRHHLLKHPLPNTDVAKHFGTTDHKELYRTIMGMGQRMLQASSLGDLCCIRTLAVF